MRQKMRLTRTCFLTLVTTSAIAFAQAPAGTAKPAAAPAAAAPVAPVAPKPGAAAVALPPPQPVKPIKLPPPPAKVDAYAAGEKKFKANDFAGALADFNEVKLAELPKNVAESRAPLLARYMANCEDKLGKLPQAAVHYDQFVDTAPKSMAKDVEVARKRSAEIHAMPAKIQFTSNIEAEVFVDEKPAGKTPVEIELAAGKHKARVVAAGRDPWMGEMDLPFASRATVNVELAAPPPPPPAPVAAVAPAPVEPPAPVAAAPAVATPAAEPKSKLPAYITGGIAVVALGVGTGFGIKALGHQSDFDKAPSEDAANSGENAALIADMAFGVALTFGITSAVLFFSGDDDAPATAAKTGRFVKTKTASKPKPSILPVPVFNSTGGGAGALIRF
jgi:PEGA domain